MQIERQEQCVKGVNWCNLILNDSELKGETQNKLLFNLPLKGIQNSLVLNKHDLVLDIPYDENGDEDGLCEMRLYFPPKNEQIEDDQGQQTQAEKFCQEIIQKANIGQFAGESLVTIPDIPLIVPRGKYMCDIYQQYIRFHGSTFNYKIDFKNIQRAFLLPKPDDVHMVFVLSLVKPLRQGSTVYPYVVMQFKKDHQVDEPIKIKLQPQQIAEQFGENVQQEYDGSMYDIVSKIFKSIVQVNIVIPGSFRSRSNMSGIRCSVKAQEGILFPLQKSLIFVNKPVIYIRNDEIGVVEFQRIGQGIQNKLFDMLIKHKNQTSQIFVGIEKQELNLLVEYFKSKNVKVEMEQENIASKQNFQSESEDDDDLSDDSRSDKPVKKKRQPGQIEEMDDESDDESFKAEEEGQSSGDDSHVDSEEDDVSE